MITMISWSASTICSHAQTSIRYDIWSLWASADGSATSAPAGADPGYGESSHFAIDSPSGANATLQFKLKIKTSPEDLSTHPDQGSIFYLAEAFGDIDGTTIKAQTPQWEFKGVCNTSTGHITPSYSLNANYLNDPPNSPAVTVGTVDYRVMIEIEDINVDPDGGGSTVTLSGMINARLQKDTGAEWVDVGSTAKVPFELIIASHLHV